MLEVKGKSFLLDNVSFGGQRAEQTGIIHVYHKWGSGDKNPCRWRPWGLGQSAERLGDFNDFFRKNNRFSAIRIKFCAFLEPL